MPQAQDKTKFQAKLQSEPQYFPRTTSSAGKSQSDLNRDKAWDFRERMHQEAAARNLRLEDYRLEVGRDNDVRVGGAGPRHAIVVLAQKMAAQGATYGQVLGQRVTQGNGKLCPIGEGELLGYVVANGYCKLKPPTS
jgi:hypothetical protein